MRCIAVMFGCGQDGDILSLASLLVCLVDVLMWSVVTALCGNVADQHAAAIPPLRKT
jgi:hypothetical protein